MTESNDTPQTEIPEDRPAKGDRGWRGLVADQEEKVAFIGTVGVLGLVAAATVIWGLPGLFLSGLVLTGVIVAVLIIISMGS
ncbi:MAG: hypothetical protein AAGG09_19470 [Pseudomonadota bacterium]